MKLSQLIQQLTALQTKNGDLDVHLASYDVGGWNDPEFMAITGARRSLRKEERAIGSEGGRFIILEMEQ